MHTKKIKQLQSSFRLEATEITETDRKERRVRIQIRNPFFPASVAPRATQDLDIFVAADEENIGQLRAALRSVFDDPEIAGISSVDLAGEYPAIQYVPPSGTFHIDILSRLGEAFRFEDIEVEERLVEGIRVPVATPRMLFLMKKDTVRPQDRADADRLRRQFNIKD